MLSRLFSNSKTATDEGLAITIPNTEFSDVKPDGGSGSEIGSVKFVINVSYQRSFWTVSHTLQDFLKLSGVLSGYHIIPRVKLHRAGGITGKQPGFESEAPFLREVRKGLESWLQEIVAAYEEANRYKELNEFLLFQFPKNDESEEDQKGVATTHSGKMKVTLQDFEMLRVVGKGSFGKVLQVRKKNTRDIYAIKVLKKDHIFKRNQVEHTKTERRVLEQINHPFIIGLHFACQTDKKLYLVLEYCPGGELFFHLGRARRFTEQRAKFYAAEILLALEYLHSLDVIYRDLKPENILLDADGHVKLTDFGLSKEGVPDNKSANSFCGTPEYLAPEILKRTGHGKAADWWSLGALLYEMLTGMPPFYSRDRDRLFDKILNSEIRYPAYFSPKAKSILSELMQKIQRRRLGSRGGGAEVKQHVFWEGLNWEMLFNKQIEPIFRPKLTKDTNGVWGTTNFDPEFTVMPIHSPETGKSVWDKFDPFENFSYVGPDMM